MLRGRRYYPREDRGHRDRLLFCDELGYAGDKGMHRRTDVIDDPADVGVAGLGVGLVVRDGFVGVEDGCGKAVGYFVGARELLGFFVKQLTLYLCAGMGCYPVIQ